jgi:hypothetical protein
VYASDGSALGPTGLADVTHPDPGIPVGDGHVEAHQADVVAAFRVVVGAQADRHGHPQFFDRGAVLVVVPVEPTPDRGDERVVQRAVHGGGGRLHADSDTSRTS